MKVKIKNFITGVSSYSLTEQEERFISTHNPVGLILFSRNCRDPEQIKSLVSSFKALYTDFTPIVLIDQEGGRVSRLPKEFFPATPSMQKLISLSGLTSSDANKEAGYINVHENFFQIGSMLKLLGISVNCAPVADLYFDEAHDIIGDRSFGGDPDIVAYLARAACEGLASAGVQSIIKHIPGHGRAMVDSHYDLPRVKSPLKLLEETDFKVFRNLSSQKMAMTAHIIYESIDPENCATVSRKAIQYIRENIGFSGLLVTDDLSMNALEGTIKNRAIHALNAGNDILLHCNGKMQEMQEVAEVAEYLTYTQLEKIQNLDCFLDNVDLEGFLVG